MSSMNGQERPTALIRRIDLSPMGQRASGAPASSRVEPCACGGLLIVLEGESPAEVVEEHNASALHSYWRWRRSL